MSGNAMINEEQYRKAYRMYLSAKGFLSTAKLLFQYRKDAMRLFTYYAYPLSVNASFSCELFLKTLLTLDEINYEKKHSLSDLYFLLPEKGKVCLENEYAKGGSKTTVEAMIETYKNAFVEWRYLFDPEYNGKTLTLVWTDFLELCTAMQIETKRKLKEYPCFDEFNVEGEN